MSHESFTALLALIGIVIIVSSLLSGAVERTGLPQVAIFLLVGAALGPSRARAGRRSPSTRPRSRSSPPSASCWCSSPTPSAWTSARSASSGGSPPSSSGPARCFPPRSSRSPPGCCSASPAAAAAILGAALASTDPVLLRTLIRHPASPDSAKLALRLESGMNDVILLPIVVLCMLLLRAGGARRPGRSAAGAVGLFLLGPMLGVFAGWVAITLLDQVRQRVGVRRDYESLYALGVAFTAYAAAEAVGGSGFLAAFAAGLVIAALDVELCDCFLDYGEASAEMFLLLTFVAFGAGLIWTGFSRRGRLARARVRRGRALASDPGAGAGAGALGHRRRSRRLIACSARAA